MAHKRINEMIALHPWVVVATFIHERLCETKEIPVAHNLTMKRVKLAVCVSF